MESFLPGTNSLYCLLLNASDPSSSAGMDLHRCRKMEAETEQRTIVTHLMNWTRTCFSSNWL